MRVIWRPRVWRSGPRPWLEPGIQATWSELGNPATDRERLHRISPLFHAHRITKPFMVLHGANDPRVLQVESDEIVAAARANGVPVEYLVFPDEGHGFVRKANQVRAWRGVLHFLDQHLKHGGAASTALSGRVDR
jgi:dipeptidyl aminopeptidase/acylaminoacyl peptidase